MRKIDNQYYLVLMRRAFALLQLGLVFLSVPSQAAVTMLISAQSSAASNLPAAVVWYMDMAKNGDAEAQYNLGTVYETGFGVKPDPAQAVDWYSKAAEQNHPLAQLKLGIMYILGEGARQSTIKGSNWIERSAKNGNRFAAVLYKKVLSPDVILNESAEEIIKILRPYIDMGEKKAIDKLAAVIKKDKEQAKSKKPHLTERFASEKSKNTLGKEITVENQVPDFLDKKVMNIQTNDNIALLQRDADAGKPDAQYQLGRLYDKGEKLEHDMQKAVMWYTKAANQGNVDADYRLAIMYIYGVGVSKEVAKGEEYLSKAAKLKHPVATKMLPIYMASRSPDHATSIVLSWYMEKIATIDPDGLMGLGYMYENGWGIPANFKQAKRWYTEARLMGSGEAAKRLRQIKADDASRDPDPSPESRPKLPENFKPAASSGTGNKPKKHDEPIEEKRDVSSLDSIKSAIGQRSLLAPLILIVVGLIMGFSVFKWMKKGYKDSVY